MLRDCTWIFYKKDNSGILLSSEGIIERIYGN